MRTLLLASVFATVCMHCSVNEAANITPPANGTPDPGAPAANTPAGESATNSIGGARLKARFLKTADGSEFPVGIYDTKLGTACSVSTAADGKKRCVPSERYLMNDPELHFADANCQAVPLGGSYPFSTARFGFTRDGVTGGAHIYEATSAQMSKIAQAYRRDDKGVCVPAERDLDWYALAEIVATDMVDGTIARGPDKGGVFSRTFQGSDASQIFAGYAESGTGSECVVGLDANGTARCLPLKEAAPARGDVFAGNTCAGTRATIIEPTMDDAKYAVQGLEATCSGWKLRLFSATPAAKAYQRDDKGTCTEAPGRALTVGAEVPPTSFPEVKESAPWGQGRVKSLYYSVGNEPVALRAQFDTTRNEGCSFGAPDNGTATCLPFALTVNSGYYADAACTTEAIPDYSSSTLDGCNAPAPRYYLAPVDRAQNKQGHVYEIIQLGENPGFLYYRDNNGSCAKLAAPKATYFAVGKEVPMTSFATATVLDR